MAVALVRVAMIGLVGFFLLSKMATKHKQKRTLYNKILIIYFEVLEYIYTLGLRSSWFWWLAKSMTATMTRGWFPLL